MKATLEFDLDDPISAKIHKQCIASRGVFKALAKVRDMRKANQSNDLLSEDTRIMNEAWHDAMEEIFKTHGVNLDELL